MEETNADVTVIICIIIGVTVISMNGCYQEEETKREAIRAGLVQKPAGGGVIWDKPE